MSKELVDLKVFEKTHAFVLEVYKVTKKFPKDEQYALTNQVRRAVASIAANIVEGNARKSHKEFRQFLYIARGSLFEVKYFLFLAKDLLYLTEPEYIKLITASDEIGKMINGLIKYLKESYNV